jgi:putative drug exporter of the RND superfamily
VHRLDATSPQKGNAMSRILFAVGHFAGRHPWRVLAVWVLVAVAVVSLNSRFGGESTEEFSLPGAESQRAADALEERFPQRTLYTAHIIFHAPTGLASGPAKTAVSQAVSRLADGEHVIGVTDPFDPRAPTLSQDRETAFTTVGYDTQEIGDDEYKAAEAAAAAARAAGVQVEYDGALGYAKGDAEPSSELIGIVAAVIVLLVAFGSLVAMSLPIVAALTAIVVGSSAIGILSGQMAVPQIASVVGLMLGLGVGIDYALFILSRHRQNLDSGMSVPEAIGRANATAGLSVLFAGVTVVVAIAGMQLSGIPMLAVMGWASALMVAVTMLAALTLLPALLGVAGRRINSLRVPFIRSRTDHNARSMAARWAAKVVARPVAFGVLAVVLLGVLATPVFSMRLGFADAGNDGPSTTTRRAYDLMADAYGPGVNGTLQVVVDAGGATITEEAASSIADAIAADPGVASVAAPVLNEGSTLALLDVTPTTGPQEAETAELLERLRGTVLPDAVDDSRLEAMVTGVTAIQDDLSQQLGHRMGWFLGAVIGLSFLLLTLVFRSVLVPLKAAVLNLLSVGASYGVVVAVFQWGWAANLIGVHETVPIMPLAPMLMFAILFGLSMDYEVFLLSRIREEYRASRDAKGSIVEGVGSTARVITSAALIMVAVFAAFVLASDVTTKLFGVGLALAVLLDVTLVRMILVPAAMSLLGDRAWWLPTWLERRLPAVDLEGTTVPPAEPADDVTPVHDDRQLVH